MSSAAALDNRLHPLRAVPAVGRLIRNPDDTPQVFVIMRAMRGRSAHAMMRRFRQGAVGAEVFARKRALLDVLQDRTALMRMAPGSLGRAYFSFMREENLSPDGLVGASMIEDAEALPPEARLFRERMRDMHDLTHVLTGYGRDPFGELCLLAFMYPQTRNLGAALIVLMGLAKFGRGKGGRVMRRALWQAWRHGRRAAWLPGLDYEALLARPLEDLRLELNIPAPTRYLEAAR